MRWLVTLAVVAALISPTAASGYSFGDWASDQGYSPGAIMPDEVSNACAFGSCANAIDSLDGIGEYDWTTTPTLQPDLSFNRISSIQSGNFDGLTNLTRTTMGHINLGVFVLIMSPTCTSPNHQRVSS
jgi:hypothetical protein